MLALADGETLFDAMSAADDAASPDAAMAAESTGAISSMQEHSESIAPYAEAISTLSFAAAAEVPIAAHTSAPAPPAPSSALIMPTIAHMNATAIIAIYESIFCFSAPVIAAMSLCHIPSASIAPVPMNRSISSFSVKPKLCPFSEFHSSLHAPISSVLISAAFIPPPPSAALSCPSPALYTVCTAKLSLFSLQVPPAPQWRSR